MKNKDYKELIIRYWTDRCIELLHIKGNLSQDDLKYAIDKLEKMKDDRLRDIVVKMIGWDEDERAELETFCAIALESFKLCTSYKLKEAAMRVELRYRLKKEIEYKYT